MQLSPMPLNPQHTFDAFAVCAENEPAYAAAVAAAERTSNPVCLYGLTGSGKSHLLHAIANGVRARRGGAAVLLVSAESLMQCGVEAFLAGRTAELLAEAGALDTLLVDDLPAWRPRSATHDTLASILRHALGAGVQVVTAAHGTGDEQAPLREEATIAHVGYPDEASRLAIARRMAARLALDLPEDVLAFLASRLTGTPRALQNVLATMAAELAVAEPESVDLGHLAWVAVRRLER